MTNIIERRLRTKSNTKNRQFVNNVWLISHFNLTQIEFSLINKRKLLINLNDKEMKKNRLLLLLGLIFCLPLIAQEVKEISVHSNVMNQKVNCTIVLPADYHNDSSEKFPVLYLLHGYSGNNKSWVSIKPDLPQLASQYKMIIICPDGKNSWYWDIPGQTDCQYETFVAGELVLYMDRQYRTIANRKGRAITGLSMGGHGGLWLSIRHKETFGAAGSTSGGVDIRPFPNSWEMKNLLGEYEKNKENWDKHTVINEIDSLKNGELALIFDCGTDDFFIEVNRNLHKKLMEKKINHDYTERPGGHTSEYWKNSIDSQLLFFSKFFHPKQAEKN